MTLKVSPAAGTGGKNWRKDTENRSSENITPFLAAAPDMDIHEGMNWQTGEKFLT